MSHNIWEETNVSECEMLLESVDNYTEEQEQEVISYEEMDVDDIQSIQQNSSFDLKEEEVSVIYNARLRLEQARLYEMLINHNLFDGVEANTQAIENVQDELKRYIVYRLEILLGLKKPNKKPTIQSTVSDFNEIEVDFLKQLAYKGTQGASGGNTVIPQRKEISPIRTIAEKPKPPTLRPLIAKEIIQKVKPKAEPVREPVREPVKTPPKVAPAQQQRNAVNTRKTDGIKIKNTTSMKPRNMTPSEIEALAKEDLEKGERKPWHEMTAKEKAKEIARVNKEHTRTQVSGTVPLIAPEQLELHYLNRQQRLSNSSREIDRFNITLATAIASRKAQQGDYND